MARNTDPDTALLRRLDSALELARALLPADALQRLADAAERELTEHARAREERAA